MRAWEKSAVLFLVKHLVTGAAGGAVLATGILVLDIVGIRTLAMTGEYGFIAVAMLYMSLMITFGSVAMGIGIMALNEDDRP